MIKSVIIILVIFLNITLLASNDRALRLYKQKYGGEKKLALVIGNSHYKSFGKLKNPINDARAVKNKLKQKDFEVLYLEDATQRELDKIIKKFTNKLRHSKVGLFYYAGHGIEVDKQNYLIPIDADISDVNDVKYETLAVNEVLDRMKRSGTRLNIIILDACRNNPFKRGSGGLAPISNAKGILIAYATDTGETASDNPNEKNGLFTKYFLKALDKPLNQRDFFYKIKMNVYEASGEKQLPYMSDKTIGDFYFTVDSKVEYTKKNTNEKGKVKNKLEKQKYKSTVIPTKVDIEDQDIWIDSNTGLMWQNEKYQTMKDYRTENEHAYTYKHAVEYCNNLTLNGYDDWYLPSKKQLNTIRTKTKYDGSTRYGNGHYIKKDFFYKMPKDRYAQFWTSTLRKNNRAWIIGFSRGFNGGSELNVVRYIRCVRENK